MKKDEMERSTALNLLFRTNNGETNGMNFFESSIFCFDIVCL